MAHDFRAPIPRRHALRRLAQVVAFGSSIRSWPGTAAEHESGAVIGEPTAARIGKEILAQGGNAVDAAVAAAFAACVVSPNNCGIGGYGGHMMIALAETRQLQPIDFNTVAPAAAHSLLFASAEAIAKRAHLRGWLSVGVPGVLAGLETALAKFGTKPLRDIIAPAIKLARDGFPVSRGLAQAMTGARHDLQMDAESARILLKDGQPYAEGETLRNQPLARVLKQFQNENSVRSFYEGDVADQIVSECGQNGGLLTKQDFATYRARYIHPVKFDWEKFRVSTPPLTAGGLTVLQALKTVQKLAPNLATDQENIFAQVEALRWAWRDRLQFFGDPEKNGTWFEHFLSSAYIDEAAGRIREAVKTRRPIPSPPKSRPDGGTVHLSAADRWGNMVALTLTHGEAFGSRVSVPGLGIVLGHGMSRFDTRPDHPNSPGSGKRPLHNMCPTIVTENGKPVLAVGGAGGRLIPSSVFWVLLRFVGWNTSFDEAIKAPRLHSEGDLSLKMERTWPEAQREFLTQCGYNVQAGGSARVSAVWRNPSSGEVAELAR